jgi:hypothetical protein
MQAPLRTLWHDTLNGVDPSLAVASNVLAVVDEVPLEPESPRSICRVALAQLEGGASILVPTRIGDAPESDSPRGEAGHCSVVAVGEGFLLVWRQRVSRTSLAWSLFAQRITRDGTEVGERLTLASGEASEIDGVRVSSDGLRALIAHSLGDDPALRLMFVEGEAMTPVESEIAGPLTSLVFVHGSFLARTADALWVLDGMGLVQGDPIDVGSRATVAPLGQGYVAVTQDELMVGRAFDRELSASSKLVPLTSSSSASLETVVFSPDGSSTFVIFHDGGPFFAPLECSDQPVMPTSGNSCPQAAPLAPLHNGCVDPVCHVVIKVDYLSAELRGWFVRGGQLAPVDADGARAIAIDLLNANDTDGTLVLSEATVSGPAGGLFNVTVPPLDFGAVALIGADSGAVIVMGGVVHDGRGAYWIPRDWFPSIDISCGSRAAGPPAAPHIEPDSCRGDVLPPGRLPATPETALEIALRTNLAAFLAQQGAFSAHVHLYTPAVGQCDPSAAEYLVVLSQTRAP